MTDTDKLVERPNDAEACTETHMPRTAYNRLYQEFDRKCRVVNEQAATITRLQAEVEGLRLAMHEIDIEAANTIPPDGKDAAFQTLFRITQIINPFRLPRTALKGSDNG